MATLATSTEHEGLSERIVEKSSWMKRGQEASSSSEKRVGQARQSSDSRRKRGRRAPGTSAEKVQLSSL